MSEIIVVVLYLPKVNSIQIYIYIYGFHIIKKRTLFLDQELFITIYILEFISSSKASDCKVNIKKKLLWFNGRTLSKFHFEIKIKHLP